MKLIVGYASYILMCIPNYTHHPLSGLSFVQVQCEPISKPPDRGLSFEGWQACVEHQLHGADELFRMGSYSQERFYSEVLEEVIALRVPPSHQYDHLMVEFEGMWFEFDTLHERVSIMTMTYCHGEQVIPLAVKSEQDVSQKILSTIRKLLIYVKQEAEVCKTNGLAGIDNGACHWHSPICTICPSPSIMILPLCLSLICRM